MKEMINENMAGKRLAVLGGGESGVGAAVLGKKAGMDVFLSDRGTIKDIYRKELENRGIPFEDGKHSEDLILNADVAVKSPGIPDSAPLVKALREKGIPVVSEIEFAGWFSDSKMICITGSNGKTTTTSLLYHIMRESGVDAGLAGNIGKSLALQVAEDPHPVYVIELSSFQLDGMSEFKADIAILLNITPDHLDRYDYKMQNYVDSKFRIARNMGPGDAFIYWMDDPVIAENIADKHIGATLLPFSTDSANHPAALIEGTDIMIEMAEELWTMHCAAFRLKGPHNMLNIAAATLACRFYGLEPQAIERAAATFNPVEHRLEFVAEKHGVKWYNDSKATNVASTFYALSSMPENTILILGGTDKGNDYNEILPLVKERVKAIVCMGVDNKKLVDFFTGKVAEIADTHSLRDAVDACARMAAPGDTVLLSPCCASFDLFKNYEDRGRQFKDAVKALS